MTASLALLGCLLAPAQTPERPAAPAVRSSEWVIVPRLSKAQELVYRGAFKEEAAGGNVQFNRTFRLESRLFVLDTPTKGAEVAFLTVIKSRDTHSNSATAGPDASAESVRLDLAHVDLQGVVAAEPGTSLTVPLEGPPTLECGAFTVVPEGKFTAESTWETTEEGRPTHSWRAIGSDMVDGVRCLKLEGVQKSDDWDQPRADRAAWRRTDHVWLSPRLGVACRVERIIERRDSGRTKPTYKSVLDYDLEEPMQYPGRLYEERQREIVQAHAFSEEAAPLLSLPAKHGPQLAALLNKIAYHLDRQPQTPYREAIFQVKRRVEAAQRGETPPVVATVEKPEIPTVATVGGPAPDFLAPNIVTSATFRLRQARGKLVLLVFYNPASPTTPGLLAYAQKMSDGYYKDLTVLALSVSGDSDAVKKQRAELKVTIPVLDGSGLHNSYGVNGTPKLMVLDGNGVVRGDYVGWGDETQGEVLSELFRWAPKH